jgi:hypothetical protein
MMDDNINSTERMGKNYGSILARQLESGTLKKYMAIPRILASRRLRSTLV